MSRFFSFRKMKPTIYMSVEEGFEKTGPDEYRNTRKVIDALNARANLVLVYPEDYMLDTFPNYTIRRGFTFTPERELEQTLWEHFPQGDLFLLYDKYGRIESRTPDADFARDQYHFLKGLKSNGNFRVFFNDPEAEEMTLKDRMIELCQDPDLSMARTFPYSGRAALEGLLDNYGAVVLKAIFGSNGRDVRLVTSPEDVADIPEQTLARQYVLQELLEGKTERRIVLLGGEILDAKKHYNSKEKPWDSEGAKEREERYLHVPTRREKDIVRALHDKTGAELMSVDFIGDTVHEFNGTSTGLIFKDHTGTQLYDHTGDLIERVMEMAKGPRRFRFAVPRLDFSFMEGRSPPSDSYAGQGMF